MSARDILEIIGHLVLLTAPVYIGALVSRRLCMAFLQHTFAPRHLPLPPALGRPGKILPRATLRTHMQAYEEGAL